MEENTLHPTNLIPDYCNERMSAAEKAQFEFLLKDDPELQEEVADFCQFKELYRHSQDSEPEPSEEVFQQILAQKICQKRVMGRQPRPGAVKGIYSLFDTIRSGFTFSWMLAAVQAVVIVLLLLPVQQTPILSSAENQQPLNDNSQAEPYGSRYTTLSADQDKKDAAEVIKVNVVFSPSATELQIRQLLQTIQGSLCDGPSRSGRYIVSFDAKSNTAAPLEILQQSEIVLLAEPIS